VQKALASLPGVEKDSIKIDVGSKQAKYKTSQFDEAVVKKAIEDLGYSVSAVQK
jgi:copper chaperone CopZ